MRSRARPTRWRLVRWLLSLALLIGVATGFAWPADARADVELPPPTVDKWPEDPDRECATSALREHGTFREFCGYWYPCATESDLSAHEQDWCLPRSITLRLRAACFGDSVTVGGQPTAHPDLHPGCRSVLEDWRPACIDSVPGTDAGKWRCRQSQHVSLTVWEEVWRSNECMAMISDPGLVEEASSSELEFCGYYGPDRYRHLCAGSGVEAGTLPTNPTDRDEFCFAWNSSELNPNGGCGPNPESVAEAKLCREYNEEKWLELGCSANEAEYGENQFCWKYGWQRYEDFCRLDTQANPDPTHPPPYVTPPEEERPQGIDGFCEDWSSGPWAENEPPEGIQGFQGEAEPGTEAESEDDLPQGAPDVFSALGARSPSCHYPDRLTEEARTSCETSGSIAHQYPIANYGLDYQGKDGSIDLTDVDVLGIATGMLQTVLGLAWIAVVYLIKGVLLLLEWAFEVPVIGGCSAGADTTSAGACEDQLPEISSGLLNLHESLASWMMVALAVAGLWGMWNGLVRQRVSYTLGGLLATLLLMGVGLAIVNNPVGTVGWVARIANDASLGVLSTASRSGADNPVGSFADAQEGLFDTLVTRPWCALQFGDVTWCAGESADDEDDEPKLNVADVWLGFESGSVQRTHLYNYMRGEGVDNTFWNKFGDTWGYSWRVLTGGCGVTWGAYGDCEEEFEGASDERDEIIKLQEELEAAVNDSMGSPGDAAEKVSLQEQRGTPTRAALLGLVVITQLGALLVLAWIAIRLFVAAVTVLLLLLLAPVMLLAPAFGESGRRAFGSWAKRLFASALAKFLFAIVLTIVVLVGGILASLSIGWFAVWLLQASFWWGLLLNHGQLMAIANLDAEGAATRQPMGGGFGTLLKAYLGYRAVRDIGGDALRAAGAPVRAMRANRLMRDQAQGKALHDAYGRMVGNRANQALDHGRLTSSTRRGALEGKDKRIADNLSKVRAERGRNQARLDQARRSHQGAPQSMRNRLRGLEDRKRALERSRTDAQRAAQQKMQKWQEGAAVLDQQRSGGADQGRINEQEARQGALWKSREEDLTDARNAERRLAQVDPHLKRAREQVDNYQPPRAMGAPQLPEERAKHAEVGRFQAEDDRLRTEEDRLRAEQGDVRSELRGLPDTAAESTESDRRGWMDNRREAIDLRADPSGDQQLTDAGINPDEYRAAAPEEQDAMRARSQHAMDVDRKLFERFDADQPPPSAERDAETLRGDPQFERDQRRHATEGHQRAKFERKRPRWLRPW